MTACAVVKMTTFGAAVDGTFVKIIICPFQCASKVISNDTGLVAEPHYEDTWGTVLLCGYRAPEME